MKEKVLNNKKNGMLVLILTTLLYLLSIAVCVVGAMIGNPLLLGISIFWMCVGWFPYCGLRVLKPQEALVLTLFGKYTGTLKGEGFYAVNPFCTSVNPAADTHLNQSGDVDIVRKIYRHIERRRILCGKSVLYKCKSGGGYTSKSKW